MVASWLATVSAQLKTHCHHPLPLLWMTQKISKPRVTSHSIRPMLPTHSSMTQKSQKLCWHNHKMKKQSLHLIVMSNGIFSGGTQTYIIIGIGVLALAAVVSIFLFN